MFIASSVTGREHLGSVRAGGVRAFWDVFARHAFKFIRRSCIGYWLRKCLVAAFNTKSGRTTFGRIRLGWGRFNRIRWRLRQAGVGFGRMAHGVVRGRPVSCD